MLNRLLDAIVAALFVDSPVNSDLTVPIVDEPAETARDHWMRVNGKDIGLSL